MKEKLQDLFNNSFSENNLNKSNYNIQTENNYINKHIVKSSSSPKYQILNTNSSNYDFNTISNMRHSKSKNKIVDLLNKSFGELGIQVPKKKSNSKNKNIFDNINMEVNVNNNKKNILNNNNLDMLLNKINNNKYSNNYKNTNVLSNYNNNYLNKKVNENNLNNLNRTAINNNNSHLQRKLINLANELNIYNNSNIPTNYMNRPITNFANNYINSTYNSPFIKGRINNLTKGENITKIFNDFKQKPNNYNNNNNLLYNFSRKNNHQTTNEQIIDDFMKGFKNNKSKYNEKFRSNFIKLNNNNNQNRLNFNF